MTGYFYDHLGIKPFTKVITENGRRVSKITVDKKALMKLAVGSQGRKPVKEAKIIEGSAVLLCSNFATPTLNNNKNKKIGENYE